MSCIRRKIEKGEFRKFFKLKKAGVHKWMKRQMNKFMRRQPIEEEDMGYKSNRKPIKFCEF